MYDISEQMKYGVDYIDKAERMKILKAFRLAVPNANDKHREVLIHFFGIHNSLIEELYGVHKKCRQQLARVELKIYYSLISKIVSTMRSKLTIDSPTPWRSNELFSLTDYINYVDRLEQLLQVRSPRANRFRHYMEKLRAKSRDYEKKQEVKRRKEYRRKRMLKERIAKESARRTPPKLAT